MITTKPATVTHYVAALPDAQRGLAERVCAIIDAELPGVGAVWHGHPVSADIERMTVIMDGYTGAAPGQLTFQVSGQVRSNPDRARASWIRAAYVVGFAALGWRYVLQPAFDPLRAYLRDPTQSTLPQLSMTNHDADPTRREILLVTEPSEVQGVFVACGGHQVILPIPHDQRTLDELSAVFIGDRETTEWARVPMKGLRVPWPRRPMHMFDPAPVQPSPAG